MNTTYNLIERLKEMAKSVDVSHPSLYELLEEAAWRIETLEDMLNNC